MSQPVSQPAPTEDKKDNNNIDQNAAKKASDSPNVSTGSSLSPVDPVVQPEAEQKSADGKLTNSEIMNMINSVD